MGRVFRGGKHFMKICTRYLGKQKTFCKVKTISDFPFGGFHVGFQFKNTVRHCFKVCKSNFRSPPNHGGGQQTLSLAIQIKNIVPRSCFQFIQSIFLRLMVGFLIKTVQFGVLVYLLVVCEQVVVLYHIDVPPCVQMQMCIA